jgi:DNA repair protein RecO (recombination protein O)
VTATERVDLEPAFVLHGRAYRETSELLEIITCNHGRVSLVARGMRRPRAGLRAILQPFQPLLVSWSGRGSSLMTLRGAESAGASIALHGTPLMSAFYVNELILRFLHKGDPHPRLYAGYEETLRRLGHGDVTELVLRRFELELLAEAGYGLNLDHDAVTGEPLVPARRYQYVIERGPVPADRASEGEPAYTGAELLAIGQGEFADAQDLQSARRLLRAVLDHYLGGQALRTRAVFSAMKR